MRFQASIGAAVGAYGLLIAACANAGQPPSRAPVHSPIAQNKAVNLSQTYRHGDRVEVRTAYIQQPGAEDGSRGFLGLKVKSRLGQHLPVVQAELDYGSFDPQSSLALDDGDHRSIWLGAQSSWQGFQYGLSYQSMGQDFSPLAPISATAAPGKNRADIWGRRQIGKLGIRTFAWHSRDQAQGDNAGLRFADTTVGTKLDYVFSSAPRVDTTFSYSRQSTNRLGEPGGAAHDEGLSHNLFGSLSVRNDYWNATASSSYIYKTDCSAADAGPADTLTESIAATYTPYPTLSISPTFTYQDALELGDRSRTKTRSASIALKFRPPGKPFLFSASSSLAAQSNASWAADTTNFSTQAGVRVPLPVGKPERRKGSLAFHVGYQLRAEATNAYASADDFLLNLELTLHEFN